MKRFLSKRWHTIPVGIITVILVVCLLAGSVFAAYNFFTTAAQVTVEEPLGVVFTPNDASASWDGSTITLRNIKAGETTGWMFWITNSASVDIPVTITWTQTGGPDTILGPGGPYPVPSAEPWIGFEGGGETGNYNPRTADVPAGAVAGWEHQGTGAPQCAIGIGFHAGHSSPPGVYTFTLTVER